MSIMNFTVEEINLVSIYKANTAAATIDNISAVFSDISDKDIITIAENASRKLSALTEPEFSALSFTPADEDNVYE